MEKHLAFYYKCLETGFLPDSATGRTGLCGSAIGGLISKKLLEIFKPTDEDEDELRKECLSVGWWGSGVMNSNDEFNLEKEMGFTPLRQTIVAFMSVIRVKDFH